MILQLLKRKRRYENPSISTKTDIQEICKNVKQCTVLTQSLFCNMWLFFHEKMLFILTYIGFILIIKLIINKYLKVSVLIFTMVNRDMTHIKKNSSGSIMVLKKGVCFKER